MFDYNKEDLNEMAADLNFVRDTLEKVLRLTEILDFLNSNSSTKRKLALKGGTAINFTVFELPRLSVDIDLDYSVNDTLEEMLENRNTIHEGILKYLHRENYSINPNSKSYHSLDSIVADYINRGGVKDNIKIEINYSLRAHLYEPLNFKLNVNGISTKNDISVLTGTELFAAKLNALLSRAAVRDLYDVNNMVEQNIFDDSSFFALQNAFVFYTAVSQEVIPEVYQISKIDEIKIKEMVVHLLPVIHRGLHVNLEKMKSNAKIFTLKLTDLTENQKEFLSLFRKKVYKPELLFTDERILDSIRNHPMIMWKLMDK